MFYKQGERDRHKKGARVGLSRACDWGEFVIKRTQQTPAL
jgi:hypothetical protein